ncbi:ATP-dependent DNA ligase [Streptomyces microflavus]
MDRGILSDNVTHARRHPAYPELAGLGAALGSRPAVLDGEVVVLDGEGRSDCERLQSRMDLAGAPAKAARMATKTPAHLMLFDIVFLDAHDLTRSPYAERRTTLESLVLAGAAWSAPAAFSGHGQQALDMTRTAGLEGLLAKRLTSLDEPSVRSRVWIKIWHVRTEDIVGGWLAGRPRPAHLTARRSAHGPTRPRRTAPLRRQRRYRL